MSGPSINETHILRPLTNFMVTYMNQTPSVWNQVVPNVPSQFKSDRFTILPEQYFLKAGAAPRAPGSRAVQLDYHIQYGTFNCEAQEAEYPLDDQLRANYDSQLNADTAATRLVSMNLMKSREKLATSRFLQTGVWREDFQPNNDGGGYWDADNSDPIKDVRTLKRLILGTTQFEPNFIVLDQDVYDALVDNQALIYRQVFNKGGYLTALNLAEAFGVQQVFVNKSVIDSAPLPGSSVGFMSSGKFLLGYSSFQPSTVEPTAFACFNWTGYDGAGALGNTVERYRDEPIRSDIYRGKFACDYQITAPSLGIFGYNVLAPTGTSTGTTTPTIGQATSPTGPSSSGASSSSPSTSSGSTGTGSTSSGSTSSASTGA